MKEKTWRKWEVAGLFFVLIWGNLFHFVYNWSGQNDLVAAIASVNESVWEHVKLLTIPWAVWSVVEAVALRRGKGGVLMARALGLLAGAAFIIAVYYTYVGVTGVNVSIVNIIIFQVAAIVAFFVSWRLQDRSMLRGKFWAVLGGILLLGMVALAVYWTYFPPALPLFTDPQTGQTGRPTGELRER